MKVIDLIKKYQLDELVKLALKGWNGDISTLLFFIIDDNQQIKEEYKNFYNMLKELKPDKNIKGEIIVDPLFGGIATVKNSKNERLEFLSWEEVLSLEVNSKDFTEQDLLYFIDELLFLMTMHGKAFDLETKRRIEYEEKVKQSLVPEPSTFKEKFLYFLRNILSIFDDFVAPYFLTFGVFLVVMYMSKYEKSFAKLFASLIDTNLPAMPIKLLFIISLFIIFVLLNFVYNRLDDYLQENFKTKLKRNIESYLKEHPEDSSFLNMEYFESFDCTLTLK